MDRKGQESEKMDRLFEMDTFAPWSGCRDAFMDALREELIFHYQNNSRYRVFCDRKGFSPYGEFTLEGIPPVSVSVFKSMGNELCSVPEEEIKIRLQSSATSGVPSTVAVDKITSRRQAKAMVRVMQSFLGKRTRPFLVMDVDPREGYGTQLGARFAAVSGYLKFSSRTGYFLKTDQTGTSYFDVDAMAEFLKDVGDTPVVVFGFTYLLYANVLKEIGHRQVSIKLPEGSKVIHIGGWKKLESEKISREQFNRELAGCFEVGEEDILDIYGFTEQMGLNYPDFPDGWKRTPVFSRVIVRDPVTHNALPCGEEGVLEFVTPIPHSYPGNAVLTDDLGIVMPESESDGRYGVRFRITGRMKKAEVRGCGDILSQKLTFQRPDQYPKGFQKGLEVLSFQDELHSQTEEGRLNDIFSSLRTHQIWLREQPVEAILGLLTSVSSRWIRNESLLPLKDKGLVFLSSWMDEKNLRTILEMGLHGNLRYGDRYLPFPDSDKHYMKANPRGVVCHWLAGNVQILGMFALVQSMLTKNANLIRVSSRDEGVFCSLLDTFKGAEYVTEEGYSIRGDDLLKTVAVISFPHDNEVLGRCMSEQADVRVAWGGSEAVRTVAGFPSKIGSETVIFGPKLSFAVIAKEELGTVKDARRLAKGLAVDVSVFDQTGCASPHNLYIEKGGTVSPEEFMELLAEEMEKAEQRIPKPSVSVEQASQIHSVRGLYDFKGKVMGSGSLSWTLLLDDSEQSPVLCSPVYSRVLFIHPLDSIFECVDEVTEDIQTIGLAAGGEKAVRFAQMAAQRGASRLPRIGRMLNFEMPWDGVFLIDRMVKWNTLGGPLR